MWRGSAAKKEPVYTRYTARNIGFLVAYVLLVAVVIANLGIVSHILNTIGNPEDRYPSREFKHVLGLLLFVNIFTLLHSFAVFHLYTLRQSRHRWPHRTASINHC